MVARATFGRTRRCRAPAYRVLGLLAILVVSAAQASVPAEVSSPFFDAQRLLADLRTLSADDMAGREVGTAGGARARALLVSRFQAAGLRAFPGGFEQPFPDRPARGGRIVGRGGVNVVGYVPGTRTPARYLVVSAHYDHVGVRGGEVFNGANDNASGAAALPAIAAHFVRRPPETTIIFAAFDGEEDGLRGSRAFVRTPPVPRETLLLNVNADMIGRDASKTLYMSGTSLFPYLKPFVSRVAASAPVRLMMGYDTPGAPDKDNWVLQSDQFAFVEAGIPALYVGVEDFRYMHRPDDDFASMMPAFYVGAVETIIAAVREFDRGADQIAAARAATPAPSGASPR